MPRRRALTDAQTEALLALPTAEPDLIRYYTLSPADLAVIAQRRRPHNRLGFAVQLCALRFPGRLLRPGEVVPREILSFVADQLDLDPGTLTDYAVRSQTRYDQLEALYAIYGFRTFTRPDQREMATWLLPVALTTTSGVAVAGLLLEELRRRAIAAPGPSVIERLVAAALLQAERHVERQIDAGLSGQQRDALEALLANRPDTTLSVLAWTRQAPGAPGHRALARLVDQLSRLRALTIDPAVLDGVHVDRVRLMVREGTRLSAQHLKVLAPLRRRAILAVTALETITRLTDDAVGLFDRLVGQLFRRAERRAAEDLQANARAINEKVRLLAKVGDALIEARRTGADAFAAVEAVVPWERFAAAVVEAKNLSRDEGPDYGALAAANHAVLRRVGPLFLDTFSFKGIAGAGSLLRALDAMRGFYAGSRRALPKDLPTGFIRRGWRAAVLRDGAIDPAAYELCLFAELRDRVRAGDVWVVGSRQYRAVEDQLVSKTLFTTMKAAGPLPVAVPGDAAIYLQERRVLLEERMRDVDDRAARHMLTDVRVTGATLKITPLQAVTPEAAERLADRLHAVMPRVRITELLAEVSHWTGLANCFTHLRTGLPAEDQRVILTAVLADATNLGLTRMAEACSVASYRQLAWTAGWHLSEEGYGRALARIVAAQQAHPLSARFGRAAVSSSDGQHFPLGGQAEVAGAVNPHKGSGPAVSFYTWISSRYAPFHAKAISVSEGEAAHVIDGLLYHGGAVDVAVHHTDGGGVSDHVFALCHLLGFRFAPRIPNLADRRLHTFGPAATWPALEPFIAGRIDEALIAANWDDLLRLATSVRIGTVPASLMLRRLGSYPRQNGLALALREVGRIERTLFTLDWLDDPALRRQATAELNKGESRNALARAVCFHRLGRLRDRTLESQQHRASGLNLVVAAIILWNTVYMDRAIQVLRATLVQKAPGWWRPGGRAGKGSAPAEAESPMPYKANEPRRHKIPKARYRVENWTAYDAALRRRGDLTIWVTPEAIAAWTPPAKGRRGRPARYSEIAIEAGLMLRLAFGRPWRQTEGLLGSLMRLLGLDLPVPDHTTFSRRSASLEVASALAATHGPVTVVIDSTGLKVFGKGEWHLEKHGGTARRSWRKLHLAVDPATGAILASALTSNEEGDASLVGPLLDQITRPINAVIADGAYDGEPVYRAIAERAPNAEVIIPPRATAVMSATTDTAHTRRDRHIQLIAERGRLGWQRTVQYGRRSLVEVAMLRYKVLIGRSLRARSLPAQKAEARAACAVINRMTSLGMPASRKIA